MKELKTIDEILEVLYNRKDIIVVNDNMVVDCVRWKSDLELYSSTSTKQVYSLPIRKGFKYFVEE